MKWISVKAERKPKFHPDDERISETVLLYVPEMRRRTQGDAGIRMGSYLSYSKEFRPDGSMGFEKYVTHWMPLPNPPKEGK